MQIFFSFEQVVSYERAFLSLCSILIDLQLVPWTLELFNLFLMSTNDLSISRSNWPIQKCLSICLSINGWNMFDKHILSGLLHLFRLFFICLVPLTSSLGCYHANSLIIYVNCMFVFLYACMYRVFFFIIIILFIYVCNG